MPSKRSKTNASFFKSNRDLKKQKRHRNIWDRKRTRLRNATKIDADSLRPLTELANDVAKQFHVGNWNEEKFWIELITSVRTGYFDADKPLYILNEGKKIVKNEDVQFFISGDCPDESTYEHLLLYIQDSWASVKTLKAWAHSQRYEVPRYWDGSGKGRDTGSNGKQIDQSSEERTHNGELQRTTALVKEQTSSRRLKKGDQTIEAVTASLVRNPRHGEHVKTYDLRIAKDVSDVLGRSVGQRRVRDIREEWQKGKA